MSEVDPKFYHRADEHINLANEHLKAESKGKVSASMMYSVARFNSWVSASGWNNGDEMMKAKDETINYFVSEYRKMLNENMNDYITNFNDYMKSRK